MATDPTAYLANLSNGCVDKNDLLQGRRLH